MANKKNNNLDAEALKFHARGRPGKLEIQATKPLTTQRDLSLAYSPGVAAPCLEIERDPSFAYDYTAKGNIVAIISNGTAVLGLGNLGALASKPVMEGKAVLFKRFADVDGIDLEVSTEDVDEFVNCVKFLGATFGGINLEDIKAPECFIIEQQLREIMDIPVFHDDQHGTAIITAAGLINALDLTGRDMSSVKVVANGAGAASIACVELIKSMGVLHDNVIMCDSKGVIHQDRKDGMNQWKSAHAINTEARTLEDAMVDADVFLGLSVKDAVSPKMVKSMADKPIIFAMANPDPEILPEDAKAARPDALIATGRSDYPNQINNVLGFPYIFRGALDVRASTINDEMKIAAAHAIAELAREDVPDEVGAAYGRSLQYGPEYMIPAPFDPRLIKAVPQAVANAAMNSGVARKPIIDMEAYGNELSARLDPTAASLQAIFESVRAHPRRVVFAEGEEEKSIRAAASFFNSGYGVPILLGREDKVLETMKSLGLPKIDGLEIHNARLSTSNKDYTDFLYERLQRKGALYRDCQRMVNQERNLFAACMVALGDADAMLTGLTRNYYVALDEITRVLDPRPDEYIFGLSLVLARDRTLFVADTSVHELPDPHQLADFAIQTAAVARRMGHEPRVALLSFSNFGNPMLERAEIIRDAVHVLDERQVSFEYDGEMGVDVALNSELLKHYPFCRLSEPANVLIMPGLHSSQIATNLLHELGGGTVIGPMLMGLSKPAQIVPMGATVSDMVNMAALAAHDAT
ncbi:MAG: NADP-dependent malic enzyme [Rhodospirillaceae bacterium]|jgi:malate dehydrogenase (oxaloacetate-decarboxylating)(NADP+)|nr:NADP-dependent malic enzyme [Rhodospirillaceae bacterium]MBT5243041.1 NADP-dependent malic enzyme [Rhodospirillaceae bacterium]MBT5563266.1 NADP-dependent malic enzyme [Rhodospirillaceae bacterium]MBT6243580.1 NADP-dependent malic enzyme [Rhodospirillaceae bacterium]MBT7136488.1 NADP-dependent malic enzyme [Rhodospirillaceae bacterium]